MKDNELRGLVLKKFYEHRREFRRRWHASDFGIEIDSIEMNRICSHLKEHNYITWIFANDNTEFFGKGEITVYGIDVVEQTASATIAIMLDQRTVTINGSNNIVGDKNRLNLEKVNSEIGQSNFSEAEKLEAKSLWQKVCDNKLLNTVISSVLGTATKHVLETATHLK